MEYLERVDSEEYRIAYITYLCGIGWRKLIAHKSEIDKTLYRKRLDFEMEVLTLKGFISYFLIVQDYVNYAKNNGVTVGPGRGSGAGSLVSYLLGITEVDPIENNLMFERFLSPELDQYDFTLLDYPADKFELDEEGFQAPKLTEYRFGDLKSIDRWLQLSHLEQEAALLEYRYIIRQKQVRYFLDLPEIVQENNANSFVHWLFFNTNERPTSTSLNRFKISKKGSSSIPDFDVDFSNIYVVQNYLWNKYGGHDHVATIGTSQTLGAKQAFNDVLKVHEAPDRIRKQVTAAIEKLAGKTGSLPLDFLVDHSPVLQDLKRKFPFIFECVAKLEGLPRNSGKHAAGIVITTDKLYNHVPLRRATKDHIATTQLPWTQVEAMGVPKFDILSLTTLETIQITLGLVKKQLGEEVDLISVDHDDKKVWSLLRLGAFGDIFQVDARAAARTLTKELAPTSVADLTALVALNRPGPLQVGLHKNYIRRKHGQELVSYVLPQMEPILKDTYGVMIYQEQLIEISKVVANYTTAQADELRKAISKTIPELIRKQEKVFLQGCKDNGVEIKLAKALFESFVKFGQYCFNRAHSRSYGEITYRMAWLKANYPLQFYTASCTNAVNTHTVVRYLSEAKKFFGIELRPPDINWSSKSFTCDVSANCVMFGLDKIKNAGEVALDIVAKTRKHYGEFTSFFDFLEKLRKYDSKAVSKCNKRVQHSLIKAGAFDRLPYWDDCDYPITRTTYLKFRDQMLTGKKFERDEVVADSQEDRQRMELEVLEVTLSGKTLDRYKHVIEKFKLGTIQEARDELTTQIAVEVMKVKLITTKKGNRMCFCEISDGEDRVNITVFPSLFEKHEILFQTIGEPLALKVEVESGEEESFICQGVKRLKELVR